MYRMRGKTESELIAELNAAHKAIMMARSNRNVKFVDSHVIAPCFRQPGSDARFSSGKQWNNYAQYLKRKGYLIMRWAKDGGMGWEVNPEYLEGENEVKTTIVDYTLNIHSKLTTGHNTAYDLLANIAKVSPSFTVGQLIETLKQPEWAPELGLLTQKTNVADERLILQKELEGVRVEYAKMGDHALNQAKLEGLNLWQLYRISQILTMPTPTKEEPEPVVEETVETEPIEVERVTAELDDDRPF